MRRLTANNAGIFGNANAASNSRKFQGVKSENCKIHKVIVNCFEIFSSKFHPQRLFLLILAIKSTK